MLTREQIIEALTLASDVGCHTRAGYAALDGWVESDVSFADIADCILNGASLACRATGLSMPEYEEWIAYSGRIRCCGTTRGKKRCKLTVASSKRYVDPRAWLEASKAGGYCEIHGG
ncbi:hypothetical protein [Paraburkholderia sp. SIMBA_030]|uniref:hypothetical protein n=1 Tax=Paraburkholderia sp. SIMBA_030 TaxID=3085773 RepID=UPI00397A2A84